MCLAEDSFGFARWEKGITASIVTDPLPTPHIQGGIISMVYNTREIESFITIPSKILPFY